MKIAVLMTCFNRVDTTIRCLRSLFEQVPCEDCSFDVFLVDDNSPDKTGLVVKKTFPSVNVIFSKGGLYWTKGMRLAWDTAAQTNNYDYYLWLNDDIILKRMALRIVAQDYHKVCGLANGLVVLVGTFSSDSSEKDVSYCVATPDGRRLRPDGASPRLTNGMINGNFVFIPRAVFQTVGPIYGKYHHAFGDYDYSWMLIRAGVSIYSSSQFVGICPQQPERYLHVENLSLIERIRSLFSPKGYSLHDTFLYRYRNWGLLRAFISCLHVTICVLAKRSPVKRKD